MRDYAQYTSRIPSPGNKKRYSQPVDYSSPNRKTTNVTTTRNVTNHPLSTPSPRQQPPSPRQQQLQQQSQRSNSSNSKSISNMHHYSKNARTPSQSPQDKRERESTSTATTTTTTTTSGGNNPRQPPSQDTPSGGTGGVAGAGPSTSSSSSNPVAVSPSTPSLSPSSASVSLQASDALSLRQQGPEATVGRLRRALDEATARDATAKAALAKSDAVILELRGSLRQVKRQLETLQMESKQKSQQQKSQSLDKVHQLQQQISDLQHQLSKSQNASTKDAAVGELQVQLDRAHAQILTADMVRKELEDTLEAEQYTWELRVQDQDRQIALLQEECDQLSSDLQEARSQWNEAEQGWSSQVEELQQQLTQARTRLAATQAMSAANSSPQDDTQALEDKIRQLEKERSELQNCLDEALQELEAVDAELQENGNGRSSSSGTPNDVLEAMQHLLRWITLEGPSSTIAPSKKERVTHNHLSRDPKKLLDEIQSALEEWLRALNEASVKAAGSSNSSTTTRSLALGKQSGTVADFKALQAQVERYQDELKSREESSAELRESLKEAVALLKPLQDAVAKAEAEKQSLQQEVEKSQRTAQQEHRQRIQQSHEMETLKAEIVHLEQQVEEQKSIAAARQSLLSSPAAALASTPRTPAAASTPGSANSKSSRYSDESMSKIQRAREELRRKRETEGNLQQLLKDAQSRFHSLHQQNENVAAKNRELQGQLQQQLSSPKMASTQSTEDQLAQLQQRLRDKEAQVAELQQALQHNGQEKVQQLDQQLEQARKDLAAKEQAEKVLNKSLKDALGLLKPLQTHLEEAEREKMDISKELRNLRKRFRQLQMNDLSSVQTGGGAGGDDLSKSTFGGDVSVELIKIKEELEETVRQLELENSQLHDALEDMSENGMAEAKLRQRLVELNSRYEVTQNKLEDSLVENHALIKALKQKEAEEQKRAAELERLRRLLNHSEAELANAKAIAKTALVKVEELTMSNLEQAMSLSRDGSSTEIKNTNNFNHGIPVSAAPGRY